MEKILFLFLTVLPNLNADEIALPKIPSAKEISSTLTPVKGACQIQSTETKLSVSHPPKKELDERHETASGTRGLTKNVDEIYWGLSKETKGFKLNNQGGNKTVPENTSRDFNFEFSDFARSDIRLIVRDWTDRNSHGNNSVMIFLPRLVIPSVRDNGDEIEVTLPTKEIIHFDAHTKEIIGGVLKEGPMRLTDKKQALPLAMKYSGTGVMIKADKMGDNPHGDTEIKGKKFSSTSIATVSKVGYKNCQIPAKDIWFTDYKEYKGRVFIKREFASDKALDQFIKERCGFSIF